MLSSFVRRTLKHKSSKKLSIKNIDFASGKETKISPLASYTMDLPRSLSELFRNELGLNETFADQAFSNLSAERYLGVGGQLIKASKVDSINNVQQSFDNCTGTIHDHDLCDHSLNRAMGVADIFLILVLSSMILITLSGNALVLLSVLLIRKMRTPAHGLIASLATADFLVAVLVMPISLFREITKIWSLGQVVCDMWITCDIFLCTASMWNVCIIGLDRYWKITKDTHYTNGRLFTRTQICIIMVVIAWAMAAVISTAPLLGWAVGFEKSNPTECMVSQDYSYTIFSTFGAFYIPGFAIIVIYVKIYKFAIHRLKKRAKTSGRSTGGLVGDSLRSNPDGDPAEIEPALAIVVDPAPCVACSPCKVKRTKSSNSSTGSRYRERPERLRRSTIMLGVIIGCFEICWLPFFLIATVTPFCGERCHVPHTVRSVVLWLGYFNSLCNPIIYAVWNKEFRNAFKQLTECNISNKMKVYETTYISDRKRSRRLSSAPSNRYPGGQSRMDRSYAGCHLEVSNINYGESTKASNVRFSNSLRAEVSAIH